MKKLFRNTNHFKLFVLLSLSAFVTDGFAAGSTVAVVNSVTGRAFVSIDGRTQSLKQGDEIAAFSEIFTEVGAQITISDYYDHKYHLAGSGHLQLLNKSVELKEGYLWVQSFQDNYTFGIQTANALASFKRGEAIVSFDGFNGRSQILVKQGEWSYSNLFNQMLQQTVTEGKFSFIHMEQDNGTPRVPTPIGYQSFQQITALFQNIEGTSKEVKVQRNIASQSFPESLEMRPQEKVAPVATVDPVMEKKLVELYQEKLAPKKPAKKWTPSYGTKSEVAVRVFGQSPPQVKKKKVAPAPAKKTRAPASINPVPQSPSKADAFESKLMEEYKNQMRHSDETNKLINELKSFKQDYVQGF